MQLNEDELLQYVMSKKETRIEYCKDSFLEFLLYYFSDSIKYPELAPFHFDWIEDFENWYNEYVEWHRESAKTTILWVAWEVRKICYRKARFICNLCYDRKKATAFNKIILNELLTNKKIINDFWRLYMKRWYTSEELEDRSAWEFTTTNWCKVKSFWMGESIRWEIFKTKDRWIIRPDHLHMDDIDNEKNTKNIRLIEEDMFFIQNEIFWWFTSTAQFIVCWNVIRTDWRNVRIRETYRKNKKRRIHQNFIYWKPWVKTGKPIWNRFVNTDKEAEKININIKNKDQHVISLETKKALEKSWFTQNWIWTPKQKGEWFIKMDWLRKISKENLPIFDFIEIWCDPAFSLKTWSDAFGIVVTWFVKLETWEYRKYVIEVIKLDWEQKEQSNVISTIYNLYTKYNARIVKVENNNWWWVFAQLLSKKHMSVEVLNSSRDKLSRMKEYETDLSDWFVFFVEWETEELCDQLVSFTGEDGNEDDLADAMVVSFFETIWWSYFSV